jgi:hypothetical protein
VLSTLGGNEMKKKERRKLRLSRETLRDLEKGDFHQVVGGMSPMTGCTTGGDDTAACTSGIEAC